MVDERERGHLVFLAPCVALSMREPRNIVIHWRDLDNREGNLFLLLLK
jgi:hypothetical protein